MLTTENPQRRNGVEHLNQAQLAQRWQMSQRTLERWRWRGEGPPFIKIGGRVVYRLEDIEAFETEQRRASTSDKADKK
jgi:predicted site-specific integrase-resolvase